MREWRIVDSETREESREERRREMREDNGNTFTVNLEKTVLVVCLPDIEHSFIDSYECTANNK